MPPVSIMVKPVSGSCNMRCSYCFYADELTRRASGTLPVMDKSTLENLLRRTFFYGDECVYLAFQGGEPTLAGAEYFRQVLALERTYNTRSIPVHHAIQTNGLCLNDDLLSVLREGRFLVGLSLDGTKRIHDSRRLDVCGNGTWDRSLKTAGALKCAGIPYNVLCVVDAAVAEHPKEVFESLAPHGFLQFIPCLDPLWTPCGTNSLSAHAYGSFLIEVYRQYAHCLRHGRYVSIRAFDNWLNMLWGQSPEHCGFSGQCAPSFVIESNGDVYPCDFYALDDWLLGNINQTSFSRLANSPKLMEFLRRSAAENPDCTACAYRFLCHGGCARDREPAHPGESLGKNRLCAGYQMFFDACLPDMRLLCSQLRKAPCRPETQKPRRRP